jgi:hypothetical protein
LRSLYKGLALCEKEFKESAKEKNERESRSKKRTKQEYINN